MANIVTSACCVVLAAVVVVYAQRRSQQGEFLFLLYFLSLFLFFALLVSLGYTVILNRVSLDLHPPINRIGRLQGAKHLSSDHKVLLILQVYRDTFGSLVRTSVRTMEQITLDQHV